MTKRGGNGEGGSYRHPIRVVREKKTKAPPEHCAESANNVNMGIFPDGNPRYRCFQEYGHFRRRHIYTGRRHHARYVR